MSVSTAGVGQEEETLRGAHIDDDSLYTGEFEIISCDSISSETPECHDNGTSNWSNHQSINVESLVPMSNLASLLCISHINPPSTVSFHTGTEDNWTRPPPNPLSNEASTVKNCDETAILSGTVAERSSSSSLTETTLSTESDATLEDVLRSQNETREMLERVIMSLSSMKKDRSKVDDQSGSDHTLTMDENNAEACSLKQDILSLQDQLYERGLEVDLRTKALKEANLELEAAYRKIADLTGIQTSLSNKCKELSAKLDETFALLIAERERVAVAEEQLRSLQSGDGYSDVNKQMVIREMQEKASYAQKLESELEKVSNQLSGVIKSCEDKDVELRTQVEIINVLKEEDQEARRELAEKEHKIKQLEEMVQKLGLDRAEVNNC